MKTVLVLLLCIYIFTGPVKCQCPSGWTMNDESCYFLHTHDRYDWAESQTFCDGHHSHLVYIESKAENDFLKGMISQRLSNSTDRKDHVWLGATDEIEERKFVWYYIEQPVTFTDWGPNEPNSNPIYGDEDCLVSWAHYNWKWADLNCHAVNYFICERPVESGSVVG
ncbi:C-type lectin domain family 17, member A-like [Mercenaria mercenaria]|uniref:C-type lectin domain family 17, member A-like n=1 Tax=Mercenaria mercenaria TaxID=6596 RepID=UPI00234F728A|nr:C-type lectin domain family 17, member A-like [Mercenaria mercenaria]